MSEGKLVPYEVTNRVMGEALERAEGMPKVILDGFPRQLEQAEWLVDNQDTYNRQVDIVVVLEVPKSELLKRLELRGRVDDTTDSIDERLRIYRQEMYPILNHLTENNITIAHIDGTGTVGQVHDRIVEELSAHGL
jgi:adenylate kinase